MKEEKMRTTSENQHIVWSDGMWVIAACIGTPGIDKLPAAQVQRRINWEEG